MGVLATGIAPASSGLLNANQSSPASKPDGGLAQNAAIQNSVATGQAAAIVSLSTPGAKRAASYAEGKHVDGTYEKDSVEAKKKKEEEGSEAESGGEGASKSKVNVSA